jgi:hypothetical protein
MATDDDFGDAPPIDAAEEIRSIRFALDQADSHLARTAQSITRWRLKRTLELMRFTLDAWAGSPPAPERLAYFRERVTALLQLARRTSPTLPSVDWD